LDLLLRSFEIVKAVACGDEGFADPPDDVRAFVSCSGSTECAFDSDLNPAAESSCA
jgi:hypothetical protein